MKRLDEVVDDIFVGLQTSADDVYLVAGKEIDSKNLEIISNQSGLAYTVEKDLFKPVLRGADVSRWNILWQNDCILFAYNLNGKANLIDETIMTTKYPKTWKYLADHKFFRLI